ncbi:flavin reductase (DIM6/NTAB) family NADH-FMN oxidoreductase RutF [Neorhizobium galegae]|uniref:flavin reductase family protein n=1 Tax=Neorhizobium galegae TaxID=399 RepID=UPI00278A8643|nr:flavin reductase family protein [Neorhizobium galegae]MDQ0137782.1 flavin reductase (DIM6/NTAB) family NADH-FMN oxidoreductase RutF [Neorhizobium galegae]
MKLQNATEEAVPDNKLLFRDLSNAWARGVAVVTALDSAGRPQGLTMRAVTPVSTDPLRFAICVGEASRSLKAILYSQAFCINYLGKEQVRLADQFASPTEDKFAGVEHEIFETGAVGIVGALATVQCRIAHALSSGDHRLLVGDVVGSRIHPGEPLVIFGGRYCGITDL